MMNMLFRFWIFNVFLLILLFFGYRMAISETDPHGPTAFDKVMDIFELLLNIGFSLVYVIGLLLSSLTIFLNLIVAVRNSPFYSFLSFLAIPIISLIYTMVVLQFSFSSNRILMTFVIFSVAYILITGLQFLRFRTAVRKLVVVKE